MELLRKCGGENENLELKKSGNSRGLSFREHAGKERGWRYINHVEEVAGKEEIANMYRYWYEAEMQDGETEIHEYQ